MATIIKSGLCTKGKPAPKDAHVTELIWAQSGTRSGAKAWYVAIIEETLDHQIKAETALTHPS